MIETNFHKRMTNALAFEDYVVQAFADKHDPSQGLFVYAGLYGNRKNDPAVQRYMTMDIEKKLVTRYEPDLYVQINWYSFFIDAKTWNKKPDAPDSGWTGNHSVDVDAEEGLLKYAAYVERPVLLAFDHPEDQPDKYTRRIGFMTLQQWVESRGERIIPSTRGSESDFRLLTCQCDFTLSLFAQHILVKEAERKAREEAAA